MSTGWDNSSSGAAQTASLEVHLLGLVDFDAALALQEYLVFETAGRTDAQGTLLLCEHPPLITMGREASRAHLQTDAADLRRLEIDVRWLSRGGGAAVHSPGQLAIYPILPLDRLQLGLMDFRQRLEDAAAATCREGSRPREAVGRSARPVESRRTCGDVRCGSQILGFVPRDVSERRAPAPVSADGPDERDR